MIKNKFLDFPVNYKKFKQIFLLHNLTCTKHLFDRAIWSLTQLKIVCLMDDDIIWISDKGNFPKNDLRYVILNYLKNYIKNQQEKD